jgi:rhomboid-like protein
VGSVKSDESLISTFFRDIKYYWNQKSQGEKLALGIIGINTLVFALWNTKIISSHVMHRYFVHDPASGRALTLWTSAYSHNAFLHLGFNMYALYGFLPILKSESGMSWEHTLAFYNGAALVSSLASHIGGILLSRSRPIIPSLGASGAIWALLAATAVVAPHIKVGIIFLPGTSFSMSELIPILMAFDAAGIILGWRTFDHVAHLAGAGFGLLYVNYGKEKWIEFQNYLRMQSI